MEMIKQNSDVRRMYRLATLGFHAGPPYMRKYIYCQMIMSGLFFVFYFYFNGGLIPWFLRERKQPQLKPDVFVLDYFQQAENDGLRVLWQHGVNSRDALERSIKTPAMMLEADVVLRGQNTPQQEMVPIVASPPTFTSDLTFKEWINVVETSKKGFELHFHSIEAVELTLQQLQDVKMLQVPVWLQANILQGPNSNKAPLNHARFLRLASTTFPHSTLSLGWTTGIGKQHENHYNWTVVKAMYDLIEKRSLTQPVTFHVRAALAWRSIAQLRWLMEMTGGTLTLYSAPNDGVTLRNLQYLRSKFSKDEVFYDIPQDMEILLEGMRQEDSYIEQILPLMGEKQHGNILKAEEWIILKADHGEKVYLGTESLVAQRGILLTRKKYNMADNRFLKVHGRVEFIVLPTENMNDLGLEIVISVVQGARPGAISGFKCFIGAYGHVSIAMQSIPGTDDARKDGALSEVPQTVVGCVHFTIEHKHLNNVKLTVDQVKDCASTKTDVLRTVSISLPVKEAAVDSGQVSLRSTGENGFVAIPMFNILQ